MLVDSVVDARSIALPIVSRSCASPEMKPCSWTIRLDSSVSRFPIVVSTEDRLSIRSPITLSLSAREFVRSPNVENSSSRLPPSPCRVWMSLAGELVDLVGVEALRTAA